jgi:peptidoglycan-N-acetylglucosamine deacetylase
MAAALLRRLPFRVVLRRYQLILLGTLVFVSGTVTPASWEPPIRSYPRPEVTISPKHPWIAFTFDDGPHPVYTEQLLRILRENKVPATFFVVGKMVDRHPYLAQQIAREGHELANHTYTHTRLSQLDEKGVLEELDKTRRAIKQWTGSNTFLYRPPGGDYTRPIARLTNKAGYKMILWSVLTKDVQGAKPSTVYKRMIDGATDNGVVLMHSGVPVTLDVLPRAIAELRRKGYQFVTISTLMGQPAPTYFPASDFPLVQTASLQ